MPDDVANQPVDIDAANTLATYRNYLTALSTFTHNRYRGPGGLLQSLAKAQRALNGFGRLGRLTSQPPGIRELLFNAWHTEVALGLPQAYPDPGLIRYTNQWAPVQAYYAVYSLWRAWFAIEDKHVRSHAKVLRSASSLIRERALFPSPWNYACAGGYLLTDAQHIGFQSVQISDVSALSTPGRHPVGDDWASKALRTTRKFFLSQREDDWKSENRTRSGHPYRRIPPNRRQLIRRQLHPTTLFDFLYRLRIRSNYRDVDDFVSGQLRDADARRYFEGLLDFTQSTMLLVEAIIREALPHGQYEGHAQRFLSSSQAAKYSGLSRRLIALETTASP